MRRREVFELDKTQKKGKMTLPYAEPIRPMLGTPDPSLSLAESSRAAERKARDGTARAFAGNNVKTGAYTRHVSLSLGTTIP